MQAVKLKAKITANHRLELVLPDDIPEGEAEVIVMYHHKGEHVKKEGVVSFLESLDGQNYPRRSMQMILSSLKKERASWGNDNDISG